MSVYHRFAEVYAKGAYPNLSQSVAEILPSVLEQYNIPTNGSRKLLDVACGEGSFAIAMAKIGWQVTGVDQSDEMLRLANHNSKKVKNKINFIKQDMRFIDYANEFDIATCWFDSLNYMVTKDDLQSTFNNIARALKPDGWFLFDMNTTYGLTVNWQKNRCYVQQETPDLLELHRTSYDYEKQIACLKITWFVRVGEIWEKYEEKHRERAFPVSEIEKCLGYAGFQVVDKLGSLQPPTPLEAYSSRIWVVAHK